MLKYLLTLLLIIPAFADSITGTDGDTIHQSSHILKGKVPDFEKDMFLTLKRNISDFGKE